MIYWGVVIFASLPTSMTLRHLLFRFGLRETDMRYGLLMVPLMAVIYGSAVWLFSHVYPGIDHDLIPAYPQMLMLVGLVAMIVVMARRIYAESAAALLRQSEAASPPAGSAASLAAAAADPGRPDTGTSVAGSRHPETHEGATSDADPTDPPVRLMRRLPDGARGPVHRMEARDHFVRVVTQDGTHDIRLRFADAVDEMDGVAGVCAHRSHWVRIASVVAAERDGVRLFLVIADGARVPVSRGYRDRVEAAGLISPVMLAAASAPERLAAQ